MTTTVHHTVAFDFATTREAKADGKKIIFLDIDGPMIPVRAYKLPGQTRLVSVFDPVATAMLKQLLDDYNAMIVLSSSWRKSGFDDCYDLLKKNGIDPDVYLHDDWRTSWTFSSTRHHEIREWLSDHPEVTHYVAVDDESLPYDLVDAVKCDTYEGFSYRNFKECIRFLDPESEDDGYVEQLKRSEVLRVKRKNEPGARRATQAVYDIFEPEDEE